MWKIAKYLAPANYLVGAILQLNQVGFAKNHQPIKAEKSDRCGSCGRVLGVEMKVIGGVCNPCYNKPEATAAHKKAMAEKKAARGVCSIPGCTDIKDKERDKRIRCSK